jgi:hypothetical protein
LLQRWCILMYPSLPLLTDHLLAGGFLWFHQLGWFFQQGVTLCVQGKSCVSLAAVNSSVLVLMDWVLLRAVQLAAVVCNALGSLDIIRSWKFAGWFRYAECVNVIRCTLMLSLSHNSKHFCKS